MSNMLEIQLFILEHMGSVANPALLFGGYGEGSKGESMTKTKGGPGDESLPVGSRGNAPVGGLGNEVPQKLLDFCELFCNLYVVSGLKNNKLGSSEFEAKVAIKHFMLSLFMSKF